MNFLRFVSIEANDTNPIQKIGITIHYTDSLLIEENSLALWYWNTTSGNWIMLPSTIDPQNNIVTSYTDHLTNFALMGSTSYLPLLPLLLLLTPSGLNPLVYLALGLVAVGVVTVAALGLRRRREEQVPKTEAPTRYASTRTPQKSPTKYARTQTSRRKKIVEVPEQEMALKFSWPTPAPEKPRCVYCGLEVPENANYCPRCHGIIANCSVCSQNIASGDRFLECPHCGTLSHRDHLLEWIKVKGYCPSCKNKLRESDFD